ncbi:glycosyl transferase [Desulfonema ishimotonii]|uniref:Glycosyl transferase n=1 Tax=Desulfonema ishimotonii TaxID=45657 RepID=A0A401FQJ3_9BACT|nr:glycosyltransferase family 2 protein [Desulfonema ishimotonii]GBC59253.1 glycosyl transferase [Desulfonema ishimotonii]
MESISVIIPAYNASATLPDAIESVLSQTYDNFKLIIVNDGSTDYTADIINRYAEKDSRIIVVHQENKGAGESRNRGIALSDSDWVTFLDADDIWLKNKLEFQVETVRQYPDASVILTRGIYYEKNISENFEFETLPVTPLSNIFETLVLKNFNFQPASALVYVRNFREIASYTHEYSGQDYYPFLLFALHNKPFYMVELPLYKERSLKGSLQRSTNSRYIGAKARVNSIRKILENRALYKNYLPPERVSVLKKGHDRFLCWMLSGARQFMPYREYVAMTLKEFSNFYNPGLFYKEAAKTLLFPCKKILKYISKTNT